MKKKVQLTLESFNNPSNGIAVVASNGPSEKTLKFRESKSDPRLSVKNTSTSLHKKSVTSTSQHPLNHIYS